MYVGLTYYSISATLLCFIENSDIELSLYRPTIIARSNIYIVVV